jgi:Pvc16 N-terminal domain
VSNPLAIAATTLTLQAILQSGVVNDPSDTDLTDTTVTILPPDKARGNASANQLNLFLYQILPNAAWRNMNIPNQVAPGETGSPPLALTLHYLLTAFGKDNDTTLPYGHHLLCKAMSILYDHALLGADEIRSATSASFPGSNLDKQVERVRITLQPMSLEEISKLWTGLVTQYRLSVGYEVSVALIDSTQAKKTPLPVLTRGAGDKGVLSQASLIPPFPALDQIQFPNLQTSARLGDSLVLTGNNLDGTSVGLVFNHPLWSAPVEIPPQSGGTATQVTVIIPNSPASWPAGFYTVSLLVQRPTETYRRATNQLSFALAPKITIAPASAAGPNINYTVTCSPEVRPEQSAALLLGDQEVVVQPHATQTASLSFQAQNLSAGDYFVRLRIDGVDSLLVNRAVTPPVFEPTQKVTVT